MGTQQANVLRARQRRPLVWDKYLQGYTYRQIADALVADGFPRVSHTTIAKDLKKVADDLNAKSLELASRHRKLQLERIQTAIKGIWKAVTEGEMDAIRELIRLLDHEAKLLGLYAPAKVDIEHRIRQMAEEHGFDPDEAVREAERTIQENRMAHK